MLIYLLPILIAASLLGETPAKNTADVSGQSAKNISASTAGDTSGGGGGGGGGGIRGMTITCFGSGLGEWDSPQMNRTLDEMGPLGVNWISFHPYAWVGRHGELRFNSETQQASVMEPLRQAAKRGLKVMLKPHLGYWGSPFSWRGKIQFDTELQWQRFFTDYEKFIVAQATMAQAGHADLYLCGRGIQKNPSP